MCDHCGCPQFEPFATLTAEHEVMRDLIYALRAADANALGDLREIWREHAVREAAALRPLGELLGLGDVVASRDGEDRDLGVLLADLDPAVRRLWGAALDHADAWEFDIFPHLMMAALGDDLEQATARGDAAVGAGSSLQTV